MKDLVIKIPSDPVPKERPRISAWGPSYTPTRTKAYQRLVGQCAAAVVAAHRGWPTNGWYRVELVFCREHARGDLDNVAKSVLDGMNGVVWCDDSRVIELHARRVYVGTVGAQVRVTVLPAPDGAPRPRPKRPAARAKRDTTAASAATPWRCGRHSKART